MLVKPSYIEAIGLGWPNVSVSAKGDGTCYQDLYAIEGSLPSKSELDAWIDDKVKQLVWEELKKTRDARKHCGVKVGTKWFHSDPDSRIQQLGLVMFGASMPPNLQWKTMDGTFVTMTPTLAQQIFGAVAVSDMTIFAISESHRAYMLASSDPFNYNYTTGWPPIFGEN